jgi:hypothetical protein
MIQHTDTINVLEQLNSLDLLIILVILSPDPSIDPLINLPSAQSIRIKMTYSISHPLSYTLDFESIFPTRNRPFCTPHNPRGFPSAQFRNP